MDHSDQEETALESEALSRLKISSEGIKETDDTSQIDLDVKEGSQQDMVEHSGRGLPCESLPAVWQLLYSYLSRSDRR